MLVISTREFRANQKAYLDKVDEGLSLLIQRGKNKSYRIVPVGDNDKLVSNPSPSHDSFWDNKQNLDQLDKRIKAALKEENLVKVEDIDGFLRSLE